MDFSQTTDNCSVRVDEELLNRLCPPHCITPVFSIHQKNTSYTSFLGPISWFGYQDIHHYHVYFIPKLEMVTFYSTIGGLISMYFGLGMVDIISYFLDKLLKIAIKLKMMSKKNIKIFKLIKLLSNLLILSLMVCQLYDISDTYFNAKEKIDIKFKKG